MKLQLIHLDPEDDQISAREKLSWARASWAVLVWPRRGRVLTRRLDLVLLQRQAQRQAVELGLVTYDPTVRQLAQELGLPTFDSPDHLPESGWQTGRTHVPPARPTRKPVQEVQRLAEQIPTPAPTLLSLSSAAWPRCAPWPWPPPSCPRLRSRWPPGPYCRPCRSSSSWTRLWSRLPLAGTSRRRP